MGWKGSPHLERTPRSVAADSSEVSPQPTPCRAHCLAFNSFSNLYLEQLLTDYSQNNPQCHFFQLTNPEYCYPPQQPLVPGSPGRNVTQRELAKDLGESLAAPARAWAADCEFPPSTAPACRTGLGQPSQRQPSLGMPRAPPLRDGKIFLEAGEAGELTWRERKLARGQLAFLLLWAEENGDWGSLPCKDRDLVGGGERAACSPG